MNPTDRLLILQEAAKQAPKVRPDDPVYESLSGLFLLTAEQIVAHSDYVPWRDEWTAIYHTAVTVLDEANKLTTVNL
jgi:hypothetical protein